MAFPLSISSGTRIAALLVTAGLAVSLTACSTETPQASEAPSSGRPIIEADRVAVLVALALDTGLGGGLAIHNYRDNTINIFDQIQHHLAIQRGRTMIEAELATASSALRNR